MNVVSKGFIINPYYELLPDYKIYPFTNLDLSFNHSLPKDDCIDDYFSKRFQQKEYIYTINGRAAINLALGYYKFKPDDVVTILTTTSNFYISRCVTDEIEKFCKWNRVVIPETKLIFVNHEFGYPSNDLLSIKKTGLPIIEDCAHSFFSKDINNTIGTIGDFIIYSFPKMFPLQIGGLLVNNLGCRLGKFTSIDKNQSQYIKNVLSHYIIYEDEIIKKRLDNYAFLATEFEKVGLKERFKIEPGIVPGVFMFQRGKHQIDLSELKKHFYSHGIQCSVFYREEAFFIPVHQNLTVTDLKYFVIVMKEYLKLQSHE